jgi:LysM repeat protein
MSKNMVRATSPVAQINDPKYNKKPNIEEKSNDIYIVKKGDTLSKIAKNL